MIYPIEYRYHGDRQDCERLRGHGRRVMVCLETMMRLGKQEDQILRFTPNDGSLIVARKFFGQRIIDIYTGPAVPIQEEGLPKICICNCNLSIGWVLEVQADDLINGAQLYTVMACNLDGTAYVPYYDVLASDWTTYEVGQPVVLVPYNAMAYICCTDKTGGSDVGPRGCTPVKSTVATTEDTWRTTYRIIPWCALRIPTLLRPEEWNPYG